MPTPNIAATILRQMGGPGRICAMTGAHTFIDHGNGVSFKFKNRLRSRGNFVKVLLSADDTYAVEFWNIAGLKFKTVREESNIYADGLIELFEQQTGMYLTL